MKVKNSWGFYEYNRLIEFPSTVHCSSPCVCLFDATIIILSYKVVTSCLWCHWPIYELLDLENDSFTGDTHIFLRRDHYVSKTITYSYYCSVPGLSGPNVHGIHKLVAAHFQSSLRATFSLFAIAERALTYSTSVWLANQCSMTVKSWSLYEYNQLIELPNTVHCSSSCVYPFDVIIMKSMCLPNWCYHHPVFQSGHNLFAMSWPIYKRLDLNW